MSFSKKIKYCLVHSFQYTNKQAQELIDAGLVEIDGLKVLVNCDLAETSEIKISGAVVKPGIPFVYLKFNKPAGYQSSMNVNVEDNLSVFFKAYPGLAIAGRLDKMSEGLLLLSNDGKWVEKICNPKFEKEKEYLVGLDRNPDENFFNAFKNGVNIGNYITQPCSCNLEGGNSIRVILKEGKNRQIRKMCRTLGYDVKTLKRIRMADVFLGQLAPGAFEAFNINISII